MITRSLSGNRLQNSDQFRPVILLVYYFFYCKAFEPRAKLRIALLSVFISQLSEESKINGGTHNTKFESRGIGSAQNL